MHYSEKMAKELEAEKNKVKHLKEGFQDIRDYLNSPKFSGSFDSIMVNKNDILLRMQEILWNLPE